MAYSPSNLTRLGGKRGKQQIWSLMNTDAIATVNTAAYISDAGRRGMQVNDLVIHTKTDTFAVNILTVNAIASGAADLTDGLAVGTTDTD